MKGGRRQPESGWEHQEGSQEVVTVSPRGERERDMRLDDDDDHTHGHWSGSESQLGPTRSHTRP